MPTAFRRKTRFKYVRKSRKNTIAKNSSQIKTLAKKVKANDTPKDNQIATFSTVITQMPIVVALKNGSSPYSPAGDKSKKFLLHRLHLRGLVSLTTADVDNQFVRMVIVQDMRKFDNNTPPTWLNVFHSNDIYTHRNIDPQKRKSFKIISDKTIGLSKITNQNTHNYKLINTYKKFGANGLRQFDYAEYSKNLLYFMYVCTLSSGIDIEYDLQTTTSLDA